MGTELNPPELAEAINAKGFMGAAGFRIVAVKPGYACAGDEFDAGGAEEVDLDLDGDADLAFAGRAEALSCNGAGSLVGPPLSETQRERAPISGLGCEADE